MGKAQGWGLEASRTTADADGTFEFPSVPSGQWNIAADGADDVQTGAAALTIWDADVNDFRVHAADPFTLAGSAKWTIRCVSGALAYDQNAAEGNSHPGPVSLGRWKNPSALLLGTPSSRIEHFTSISCRVEITLRFHILILFLDGHILSCVGQLEDGYARRVRESNVLWISIEAIHWK